MTTPNTPAGIFCSQCGGELHPDEGQYFVACPFCTSTVFLDKSQVVFHWYLVPTVDESQARAALARWMAGNETVKDLDKKSRILEHDFHYFPVWYFKSVSSGRERIILEPAAATSVTELRRLTIPAGDLRKYDGSIESQSLMPTVPLEAAKKWLSNEQVEDTKVAETALVHIPVYSFKYSFENKPYTAIVEGATAKTIANIFPAKAEAPYRTIGCLTAVVFLILAFIPVIGGLISEGGAFIGLAACLGIGLPAGLVLFAIASWVASRV